MDEEEDAAQEEDEEEDGVSFDAPWSPDLDWLGEHLAVGACFPAGCAGELARAHGIGAVVDLRSEALPDEAGLRAAGIDLLHLPTPDMRPPPPDMLDRGVVFVREHVEAGDKVLIHCHHGIGRSALLALCVLVDQGASPLDAIRHAKDRRERVSPSPSQFAGWCEWLIARGQQPPTMHEFGCIAYRHLASG